MSWERGRYYTRSRRRGGRVVRRYVGSGRAGRAAAAVDGSRRRRRERERANREIARAFDFEVRALSREAEATVAELLAELGVHRPGRGGWRRRRG